MLIVYLLIALVTIIVSAVVVYYVWPKNDDTSYHPVPEDSNPEAPDDTPPTPPGPKPIPTPTPIPPGPTSTGEYKGLVLFDVDGTLTTGKNNEKVVQACIDNGWAVGICTAGSIYSMDNLNKPPFGGCKTCWMPDNLYQFIAQHDDITFNNIASGFLMGKENSEAYKRIRAPQGVNLPGYLKGFALEQTGKALGITNPNCLILCDDNRGYISGVLAYNKNLGVVCSGADCGGQLTVSAVQNAMKRCK